MHDFLRQQLQCPACSRPLQWVIDVRDGPHIETGRAGIAHYHWHRILDVAAACQKRIRARLETITAAELAGGGGEPVGRQLTRMLWHEAYHIGQIEPLRRLAGRVDHALKKHGVAKRPWTMPQRISGRLRAALDRWQPPAELVFLGTSLLVGISTGIGAILFRYLIDGLTWVGYTWLPRIFAAWGFSYIVLLPALGGLLVGLIAFRFAAEVRGSGVPEVIAAVALRAGRIRPRIIIAKPVASAISIASGGSVGREGPIVHVGSAIGSTIGQLLKLSDDRVNNLVAGGAAAGIAATFNAPIAGVIFALEVILGRFTARYFSSVVIAAVSASVIGRVVFGDQPAFRIPVAYGVNSLWEYLFYPVLGVLAAMFGVLFMRTLYWSEDLFNRWSRLPDWVRPALGGALLGVLALLYPRLPGAEDLAWTHTPHIFNVGYDVIEAVLANQLTLGLVAGLLLLKLMATSLTLGSGGSGGVFAPSLFMGAMLGAAFQLSVTRLFPGIAAPPGAYALVGMAAFFAACAQAPITAILILFELTGDYQIILPLMLTVVIATLLSQRLTDGESIYMMKLSRRGIRLRQGRDVDILQSVIIEEVMTHHVETVPKEMALTQLAAVFAHSHHHGLMVVNDVGELWGVVSLSDLERALASHLPDDTTVSHIATAWPHLVVAFPDETIGDALRRMGSRGLGRLPVVARDNPYHLLGLLWREDIIKAYNLALMRRANVQHQAERMERTHENSTEFVDIYLRAGDPVVGKAVSQVAPQMPKDCVLISIMRDERMFIPHGDTVFHAGDRVTAFVKNQESRRLFECLHGGIETEKER